MLENWKEKLTNNLSEMVSSKKLVDFENVTAKFESVYKGLIKEVNKRDTSLFKTEKSENSVTLYIHDYFLGLFQHKEKIYVTKKDENKSLVFAEIIFDNDFSFVRLSSNPETQKNYLSEQRIENLFKMAFEPLTK